MIAPIPLSETERLRRLEELNIIESLEEEEYNCLTKVVAAILDVPIAFLGFIDRDREWFKSQVGFDTPEIERDICFCSHAILGTEPMVVTDATKDPRFAHNPLLSPDSLAIRFYVGVPILYKGEAVGALCGIDTKPRELTARQSEALKEVALVTMRMLDQRRAALKARQQEILTKASEEHFRAVIESLHEGLVVQDKDGRILVWNPSAERLLGLTGEQLIGRQSIDPRWRAIHPDGTDFPGSEHPAMVTLRTGLPQENVKMGVHHPDGELVWLNINTSPVTFDENGKAESVVCSFFDITRQLELEEQFEEQLTQISDKSVELEYQKSELERLNSILQELATIDGLTGLKNHRTFQDSLKSELLRALRYESPLSLALLDVDHFKKFNDDFGHQAGDAVLKAVAKTLEQSVRTTDLVARYGGEEFVVLMPETGPEEAVGLCERLRRAIEALDLGFTNVTASFGISTASSGSTRSSLIQEADAAMYASKRAGRNRVLHGANIFQYTEPSVHIG